MAARAVEDFALSKRLIGERSEYLPKRQAGSISQPAELSAKKGGGNMTNIFDNIELLEKRDELRDSFMRKKEDKSSLQKYSTLIDVIDEWKYSTGPIFDQPPYTSEMSGFDGGRLLKRSFRDPFEARLKGAYSSGFKNGAHVVTIDPSKPASTPIVATFFSHGSDVIDSSSIRIYNNSLHSSLKQPELIGVKQIFNYSLGIKVCVGVGSRNSYTIIIYYCDSEGLVSAASMATAPFDVQANYRFEYDSERKLCAVTSGVDIWRRKSL
ncbi:hypothetical protein [Pseudoduganella albidiflava]|uniref:Uncharacterized protein n=1 Tax=Pseudoduganella albidiflava TaxID=321983 RepID=A0A411WRS9_9BURK|nr:hypothetical protein [Pseudoduganella albidiflava]QBH99490.1 hypothetical protein EYF70_00540 [Pseudoduganella albidiflava]GGY45273.1 hypothetical protein GCM10007387_29090 [Pseudoduganella albidiflava]